MKSMKCLQDLVSLKHLKNFLKWNLLKELKEGLLQKMLLRCKFKNMEPVEEKVNSLKENKHIEVFHPVKQIAKTVDTMPTISETAETS